MSSPPAKASRLPWLSASSSAMALSGKAACAVAWAATIASASGSRAHCRIEEVVRVGVGQLVQGQRMRPLTDDQAGELVAAGDDDQAAGGTGQQWTDLAGVAGVVEEDQHPALGEHAAVQRRLGVQRGGDAHRRDAERVEEDPDGCLRRHDRTGRIEAAQVDVELSVGEAVGDLVRPVHGQGGLADAAHAADRTDHDRGRRAGMVGQQGSDTVEFGLSADERGQIGGQLRRAGRVRGDGAFVDREFWLRGRVRPRGRGQVEGGVGAEDALVQVLQGGARVDAQLGRQGGACPVVGLQRLGLSAGPVQRQHEQSAQPLPQGVGAGQGDQFGDHLAVPSEVDVGVQPGLQYRHPLLGQPVPLGLGQRAGDTGECRSLPAVERGVQQLRGVGHQPGGP